MSNAKKAVLVIAGTAVLIGGLALVLLWWDNVVWFFKGAIGMILAVTGLVLLALVRD